MELETATLVIVLMMAGIFFLGYFVGYLEGSSRG